MNTHQLQIFILWVCIHSMVSALLARSLGVVAALGKLPFWKVALYQIFLVLSGGVFGILLERFR